MSDDIEEVAVSTVAAQDVADDIEVLRSRAEIALEDKMSAPQWVDRLSQAAPLALGYARIGSVMEEYKAWVEMASFAAGRAEQIRRQQIREGE